MVFGIFESVTKHMFTDLVQPVRGCIAKIELAGKFLTNIPSSEHTGIYVSNDSLIELTNDDQKGGIIQKVNKEFFMNSSKFRTGLSIYIAGYKKNGKVHPIILNDAAYYAERCQGQKRNYDLMSNNCHRFTTECILRSPVQDLPLFRLAHVKNAISRASNISENNIDWYAVQS